MKKIFEYIANQVFRLAVNLNLDFLNREKVWIIMKYILSNELNLLKDQFIDIMIIASFYAVIRLSGNDHTTFNHIIGE